jgi:hypothetical protein
VENNLRRGEASALFAKLESRGRGVIAQVKGVDLSRTIKRFCSCQILYENQYQNIRVKCICPTDDRSFQVRIAHLGQIALKPPCPSCTSFFSHLSCAARLTVQDVPTPIRHAYPEVLYTRSDIFMLLPLLHPHRHSPFHSPCQTFT